eukprot:maker-scaffold_7-augustus-gene-14.1-mRNA-1 protein AED:0.00 eAED:0.00 QI:117/1/1/1/0.5/0.33/3/132/462
MLRHLSSQHKSVKKISKVLSEMDFSFLTKEQKTKWQELQIQEKNFEFSKVRKPTKDEIKDIRAFRALKKQFISSLPTEISQKLLASSPVKKDSKTKKNTLPEKDVQKLFSKLKPNFFNASSELIDIGMNLHDYLSDEQVLVHIRRARAAGVTRIILTGSTLSNSSKAFDFCQKYYSSDEFTNIGVKLYHTVGIHPHCAKDAFDSNKGILKISVFSKIQEIKESPFCVSLGECGLDYDRMLSSREVQVAVFKRHIEMFLEGCTKPLFVHLREPNEEQRKKQGAPSAIDDLSQLLKEISRGKDVKEAFGKIIVHCYTSDETNLRRLLDLGVQVGFTGYVGLRKRCEATGTAQALRSFSRDHNFLKRLMIETDAPYMKPDKNAFVDFFSVEVENPGAAIFNVLKKNQRGSNEPAVLPIVAKSLANLIHINLETVYKQTSENTIQFFKLDETDAKIVSFLGKQKAR